MKPPWEDAQTLEELLSRLPRIEHGRLTRAELDVAYVILKGLDTIEAAEALFRTDKTIKFHLSKIYKKTAVTSRYKFLVKFVPGLMADKFMRIIEEKQKRIAYLEWLVDEMKKELGRNELPRGI